MSQHMTSYTRWSFNYPPGTAIPDGFVYGISYALFGIDSLSGYVLASRAPAGAWEPGASCATQPIAAAMLQMQSDTSRRRTVCLSGCGNSAGSRSFSSYAVSVST